jgi:hypothetical protein
MFGRARKFSATHLPTSCGEHSSGQDLKSVLADLTKGRYAQPVKAADAVTVAIKINRLIRFTKPAASLREVKDKFKLRQERHECFTLAGVEISMGRDV